MEVCDLLDSFLPQGFQYKVISSEFVGASSSTFDQVNFNLIFRVDVSSIESVKHFLRELNKSSGCTFNIKHGRQDKKPSGEKARCSFSGFRKCCLNVFSKLEDPSHAQEAGKNTDCPAFLTFRLETPLGNGAMKKEKEEFPLWLHLHFNHNHSLHRADYFKFLSVNKDTKAFYNDMFSQGKDV